MAFLERHEREHVEVGPYRCSCGWPGDDEVTVRELGVSWQRHADSNLIAVLGDVLPSDESMAGHPPYPWRELVRLLNQIVDHKNTVLDRVVTALREADEIP